jgi:hypothetical protein
MSAAEMTAAEEAVNHVLNVIYTDGRVAYLLGFGTESFSLLTAAHAETIGEDVEVFRKRFWAGCRPERVAYADTEA